MFDSCSSGSFRHKTPTAGTTTPKSPFFGKIKKRVPEFPWKNSDRGFRKNVSNLDTWKGVKMKLYTAKAVAAWLGMTERNVRKLRDKNIIKEFKPGLYKLQDVTQQYITYLQNKNPETEGTLDYNEERAKLMRAKRESVEVELRTRRNELHEAGEVEQVMTDMLIRFKTKMMAIPAKQSPIIASKTDQTEIFSILKRAIEEALDELATYEEAFGENEDGEENV